MTTPYRALFDRVLTRIDPEAAHHAGFAAIRAAGPVAGAAMSLVPRPAVTRALGLEFPGRLGLAAGFDKNGTGIDGLAALGFGFVEIGTVTARPQPGNPKPRLARLVADQAIVNRMGFNNDGAEVVAERLAARSRRTHSDVPLGINIGKTKVVPEDDVRAVIDDHLLATTLLAKYADYLVVNVSSPNTPGLRSLQAVERLEPLLTAVRERAGDVAGRPVPLLVKIAPDLADADVLDVADLAKRMDLAGLIATNTTIAREGLRSSTAEIEAAGGGGLSGVPLRARATEVLRLLRERLGPSPVLIGVGGITTEQDARDRLAAGADLLQAYTAFVYQGALWPRRINKAIEEAGA